MPVIRAVLVGDGVVEEGIESSERRAGTTFLPAVTLEGS